VAILADAKQQAHAAGLGWRDALVCYLLSSSVCMLGLAAGPEFLPLQGGPWPNSTEREPFANWDGEWYEKVARHGYEFNPHAQSSAAFFPAYPMAGKILASVTGLDVRWALFVVSHLCLAASFCVLGAYARLRFPKLPTSYQALVLLSFALLPVTFFFRMVYSESAFFLCVVLALYGMERCWPVVVVAGVAGLATGIRPVGVALLVPLALHIWQRASTFKAALADLALALPLACWGMGAFMVYEWRAFGDPLAFVKAHGNWRAQPAVPVGDKLMSLASLQPITDVFNPASPCCWRTLAPRDNAFFNWRAANPVWWLAAVGLIYVGAWTGWLNFGEIALSTGLLLIPYLMRAQEMCMMSMGRFAGVVAPIYLVLGHLLWRMPRAAAWAVLGVFAVLLASYSAMFAVWYAFF